MDGIRGWWKALRALVRKEAVESELSEELAFHLEMETEKNVRAGMTPEAARRAARVSFGGVDRYKEEVRAAGRTRWLEATGQDLRSALRTFRRAPGLVVVVVLTLGLGIGATTSIFSIVHAAVLEPLPFPDPEDLVLVREVTPGGTTYPVSQPNYLDFRAGMRALSELAAFLETTPSLTGDGEPERLRGLKTTHTFFPLLGARAAVGRTFGAAEDEPGADTRVAVLGHTLWQRRFGGDSAVVGSRVVLDGEAHVVIGVMPADFSFFGAELWTPLAPDARSDRTDHWLNVMGRLAPGTTAGEAEAELTRLSSALGEIHPAMAGWAVEVRGLAEAIVGPEFRRASAVLAGAVGLLLLMACANVANLLLARATTRQAELGIRAALGAGRVRLLRQLLTESLVLALGGAAVGLLGAVWAVSAIRAAAPASIPRVEHATVDLRVLGFAAAMALLTALLSGFFPALQAAGTDAAAQLRAGGRTGTSRGQRRLRDMLVVAQMAVAVLLLLGAGLMTRSFLRLQAVDPGFRTEGVWSVPLSLPQARYGGESAQFLAYEGILERIRSIPGVAAAGGAFVDPFSGMNTSNNVTPAERAAEVSEAGYMQARWRTVTPSYFEVMDVPLLRGRLFTEQDRYGNPPTVIITRTLAERLWPAGDAVGERLFWGGTDGEPRTVIGVVGDIQDVALEADPAPLMFLSHRQLVLPSMTLLVRSHGDVPGLAAAIRQAVWAVDPALPVPEVRPMTQSRAAAVAGPRFNTLVLAAFAAVSLALAAVGLYGLLAFLVARRTREIGVRRALGARTVVVSGMVVRRGLILSGLGIAIGVLGALGLTRFLQSLLYDTAALDPLTFIAVPGILALVALLASWVPARRAGRVEPVIALRSD